WADDQVRPVPGGVEQQGRDRDEGDQVEQARDKGGLPHGVHRDSCRCGGSVENGHVILLVNGSAPDAARWGVYRCGRGRPEGGGAAVVVSVWSASTGVTEPSSRPRRALDGTDQISLMVLLPVLVAWMRCSW